MDARPLSILFSVIGIFALFLLSLLAEPIHINLSEINKYNGREVIIQGIVVDKQETRYGNIILTLAENHSIQTGYTVKVFIEGQPEEIEYGDKIMLQGEVHRYQGEIEIYVSDIRQIKTMEKWNNHSIPLREIAKKPWEYKGINLKILCRIEKIYHTYIVLKDIREDQKIILFCNTENITETLRENEIVNVEAMLRYNPKDFSYFLEEPLGYRVEIMEVEE
ncbi:MAG: hypothetical protein J7J89_02745 [Thermoplasmata archaeon]|nr:hypothetical protein [Thermoplasmata archaeon]